MPNPFTKKIHHAGSDIMVPVDIQGQTIVVAVTQTHAQLNGRVSVSVPAGGDATVDVTVPYGEVWEINITNHLDSGADITLNRLYVSPDGGNTFYSLSNSHLNGQSIYITGGNKLRASFHNAGTSAETAYLNYFGRKLKV